MRNRAMRRVAGSIGRLGGLEERPLKGAPELIGQRAETARQRLGELHAENESVEGNLVSMQPVVARRRSVVD
jgi:hypothetical protein